MEGQSLLTTLSLSELKRELDQFQEKCLRLKIHSHFIEPKDLSIDLLIEESRKLNKSWARDKAYVLDMLYGEKQCFKQINKRPQVRHSPILPPSDNRSYIYSRGRYIPYTEYVRRTGPNA
ncbi:uncharacterized protein LOC119661968 [Teleopsis dalmanni]|uniref:uncharacterized protein LOC119661968 n=1 Tax=Teleopsis dalmanni TaxID=139649 RepID=UPI0018CDB677|nr:uncharacterized protein LOC119661968 [Teleopsis dalmanni]